MTHIWNPWHGCHRLSEGCRHCYMYELDRLHQVRSGQVSRVKTNFDLPVRKDRHGRYKVPPGTQLATCLTSDFFIEEADPWRPEAWRMMRERSDCIFYIITKRVERIAAALPADWGAAYDHVLINVTAENQRAAELRLPLYLELPLKYRGVIVAPILEAVDLRPHLATGLIDQVSAGGESYSQARVTRFEDILAVREQCLEYGVSFHFHQTGSRLLKDGRLYHIPHRLERQQAHRAGLDT